jgi:hypothetical protein
VAKRDGSLCIPESEIVTVRDAIAHGRVYGRRPAYPLRLVKFSEAKDGFVTVVVAETLTPEWLAQKRRLLHDAIDTVVMASTQHGASWIEA